MSRNTDYDYLLEDSLRLKAIYKLLEIIKSASESFPDISMKVLRTGTVSITYSANIIWIQSMDTDNILEAVSTLNADIVKYGKGKSDE